MNTGHFSATRPTWVCWLITSLTSTPHGSRVVRHGSSRIVVDAHASTRSTTASRFTILRHREKEINHHHPTQHALGHHQVLGGGSMTTCARADSTIREAAE